MKSCSFFTEINKKRFTKTKQNKTKPKNPTTNKKKETKTFGGLKMGNLEGKVGTGWWWRVVNPSAEMGLAGQGRAEGQQQTPT